MLIDVAGLMPEVHGDPKDEILAAIDAAAVWSLAGYLHLPAGVTIALAVVLGLPAIWACWKVTKLALEAERGDADTAEA